MIIRELLNDGKYSTREIAIKLVNYMMEHIFNETIDVIPPKEEYTNSIDLISLILSNKDLTDADIVMCAKIATSTAIDIYYNEL